MKPTTLLLAALALCMAVALSIVVDAHGMHAMHAMHAAHGEATTSTTDYKCPVCRMSTLQNGYDNANWVQMANGQRVYTCGMDPRAFEGYSFESTDTAYLGANMAEFIVAPTDTDNYKCTSTCDECAQGLKDPISGADITTANFKFVCLANAQKIYFASDTTRTAYLAKVNQAPREAVESMICKNSQCSDATQITTLSAAAKSFDPSKVQDATTTTTTTTTNSTTTAPTTTTNSTGTSTTVDAAESNSGFCSGEGSVMFNGFQSTVHGSCVRLFFQPWVINSAFKYVLAFFGCLLLALGNEYLVKFREQLRKKLLVARKGRPEDKKHRLMCKLLLSGMYMIQMTVAYFAMLVVMTYETGLFIALILGFGVGFVLFKDFDQDVTNERGAWRYTDPSVVRIHVEGMSCMANCGTTVENALKNTEGVTNAYVDFDEKFAYVAGSAPHDKLIDAVEAVGFTAQVDQANLYTPANV